ncbi:Peptide chain release factor 2 [Chlamydia avium]|uniref:Peptide chain release factor 2 n=2 Tax=Chlamydia avium TaxID=1457141 RepID=W8JSJ5_9CHLA|nr:Peptide chain release factor 2 [Chlamydia avium 10DC88]EPP36569.1 peptide chain release factor 2 [Chlamydia psittaci 10_743_SC13]EPP38810.1 peptide chain release factor 2 [Chlamydia avium]VVT43393.1 Peptide chain release factor 2 [Chlamydia avium]
MQEGFWQDTSQAGKVSERIAFLRRQILNYHELKQKIENLAFFLNEGDDAISDPEFRKDLEKEFTYCERILTEWETQRLLAGEADKNSCFLTINAGAGGTESCDWVEMLFRMYTRWAASHQWQVEIVDRLDGDVAGIKHITIKISGEYAYGYAKAERGVHRLVRISPFDSNAKRHTSFASVDVYPEIDDQIEIDIRQSDLRIDTYRSSGAGGQHVNVTDSAVRITHLPTGIVVSCQSERSQIQNRESCMKMLRARMYQQILQERLEKQLLDRKNKKEIAWGSQIRNYVFQPYTLVKDVRTGHETGNVQAMMDGELLDGFIKAYLVEYGEVS